MKRLRPSFKPAVFWLLLTTLLLCLPGSAFPGANWFSKIWLDKWVHLALFGMMVLLWNFGATSLVLQPSRLRQVFVLVTIMAVAYGIAMEYVQANFIPHRAFDIWDIVMNTVGSGLGLGFCLRYFGKQ